MCQRKYGTHGELFFFLDSEGAGDETFRAFLNPGIRTSYFSADVLKKCAQIALHVIAEEGRGGEDGCHAPELGDARKFGLSKESNVGK